METHIRLHVLSSALIVTCCLSGCAAYTACRSGDCADDAQITSGVQKSIDRYGQLGPDQVDIQTIAHVVYLYGLVNTDLERDRAEEAALETPGVARVVNSISVNNRG